jgi:hypothetical protein
MIDLNPERDQWITKYFSLIETWTKIINVLARKAILPPPEDQTGAFTCPYCYLDTPHCAESHDSIADAIDATLSNGIVLSSEKLKVLLRFISKNCRQHGAIAEADRASRKAQKCIGSDPACPCQDGDACHYKGENPFPIPEAVCPTCKGHRQVIEYFKGARAYKPCPDCQGTGKADATKEKR